MSQSVLKTSYTWHPRTRFVYCTWFDGKVAASIYDISPTWKIQKHWLLNKQFKGYIKIPKETIRRTHEEYCIRYAEVIEPHRIFSGEDILFTGNIVIFPIKNFDAETHKVEYGQFHVDTRKALIPAQDLHHLYKGTEQKETHLIKRQIQQEDEILRVISEMLELDPLRLPKSEQGRRGVKSDVLEEINNKPDLRQLLNPSQKSTIFRKAWERLLEGGRIRYQE